MTTTNCPNCGREMGLVTWTGEKPECAICSGQTVTNAKIKVDRNRDRCVHEELEKSLPPSQKGGAHMLVCNCPKCRITC